MVNNSVTADFEEVYRFMKTIEGEVRKKSFGVLVFEVATVLREAELSGVSWDIIPNTKCIKLSHNGVVRYFFQEVPHQSLDIAGKICGKKSWTKAFLEQVNVSVPRGNTLSRDAGEEEIVQVFDALRKPVVVKPLDGMHGRDITLSIQDKGAFDQAIARVLSSRLSSASGIIVEEMFDGKEYRILATREKVIGVVYREPANVVGDGTLTLSKLIEAKNMDSRRGKHHTTPLELIQMDTSLKEFVLEKSGLFLDDVPQKGKKIYLRAVSNISQGGDSIDVTDIVHPSVIDVALCAVNAIPGLEFCGVDFMTKNIEEKQTNDSYIILEMNTSPGFGIHDYPYEGKNRGAAKEFLFLMFPELREKEEGAAK